MHSNITKDNLENIMHHKNALNTKQSQVPTKRSAFTNISNVMPSFQNNNGKQAMKKMDVKQENPSTRNQFVQPTQAPITSKMTLNKPNPTKNTHIIEPVTKKEKKVEEELEEEGSEIEDEDLLDMSISVDDMSNMSLENIDEYDHEDPSCCAELVNEIYEFLRMKEVNEAIEGNYFETTQKDINQKMRSILIDWLVDVHLKFKLLNDTLFMTVSLIDRFLAKESVSRKKLQLVGVTAMLIASKFEEIYAPEVGDFVYICDKAYSKEEILQFEVHMLNTLSFEISHPTPIHFLRRFSKAAKSDSKAHTLSKYLIELSLMEFDLQKKPFTPSMIAAASIYITRKMMSPKLYWNSTLRHYTQYKESDLMPCVQALNELLKKTQKGTTSLNAIHRKYSSRYFGVANIPYVEM